MSYDRYVKMYNELIDHCKARKPLSTNFYEVHHITPRSLGGTDSQENLVKLTPREHFHAHLLLARITTGAAKIKMAHALRMMSGINKSTNVINSKQYNIAKTIIHNILQSAGKDYKQEKELQDEVLTEYTDLNKVFERGTCKCCGIRPRSINYIKNNKTFYRSKCEVCLAGNNKFKVPQWKFDGYSKLNHCEICNFSAKFTEQLTVIIKNKKYKTICLNCQMAEKLNSTIVKLKPSADF
jgi:hypothetical protein